MDIWKRDRGGEGIKEEAKDPCIKNIINNNSNIFYFYTYCDHSVPSNMYSVRIVSHFYISQPGHMCPAMSIFISSMNSERLPSTRPG